MQCSKTSHEIPAYIVKKKAVDFFFKLRSSTKMICNIKNIHVCREKRVAGVTKKF